MGDMNSAFLPSDEELNIEISKIQISENILGVWQKMVDVLSRVLHVDLSFISNINRDISEFIVVDEENTHKHPVHQEFNIAGHYCEKTIKNKQKPHVVEDASKSKQWKHMLDYDVPYLSYLGYPVRWPNGVIYGTLCVVNHKSRNFKEIEMKLMTTYRDQVQSHLSILYKNEKLEQYVDILRKKEEQIKKMKEVLPMCMYCNKIRDEDDEWHDLNIYLSNEIGKKVSHGVCPDCYQERFRE